MKKFLQKEEVMNRENWMQLFYEVKTDFGKEEQKNLNIIFPRK